MNSVAFIYWFNGDGMAEFVIERSRQNLRVCPGTLCGVA